MGQFKCFPLPLSIYYRLKVKYNIYTQCTNNSHNLLVLKCNPCVSRHLILNLNYMVSIILLIKWIDESHIVFETNLSLHLHVFTHVQPLRILIYRFIKICIIRKLYFILMQRVVKREKDETINRAFV